jgi:hypothetical protein
MAYFNYHASAKKLIEQGKLICYYFCAKHNSISPALVLVFDHPLHKLMPIRKQRWQEYIDILPKEKQIKVDSSIY